jgi:hypothetical protein
MSLTGGGNFGGEVSTADDLRFVSLLPHGYRHGRRIVTRWGFSILHSVTQPMQCRATLFMNAPAVIANGQVRGTALGDRGDLKKECLPFSPPPPRPGSRATVWRGRGCCFRPGRIRLEAEVGICRDCLASRTIDGRRYRGSRMVWVVSQSSEKRGA